MRTTSTAVAWVVCRGCGEWNLTPLEERWEAVEACERHFRDAVVRASSANIGLARVGALDLIRIGHALRDELANWRYGPRFERRRRRTAILSTAVGVLGGGVIGAVILAGASTGSAAVVAYLTVMGAVYAGELARSVRPRFAVCFVDARGRRVRLPQKAIHLVELVRDEKARRGWPIGVSLPLRELQATYWGDKALPALGAVLPRVNWRGASPADVSRATTMVGDAEQLAAAEEKSGRSRPAWANIATRNWPAAGRITHMDTLPRLALEMAVTEEIERRSLAGEADSLGQQWREAEEVAEIADNMFLPAAVTDWLARRARRASARGASEA